ncbi:unannotated protein [freshwater metagenome]|uniref:Unannotated protein n=1 Tax=freshwater metagenome TaxID=449393 RepID=A0A6J6Q8E4_9ZZZZ|nr:hypothetical protein [Actinomycetota bacterium]MSX89984.1 hypothetical protein [Actinomycetota bacterium]MSZ63891.1 hypothetical protein [Actinomycetota bacterium]MTA57589.1 hypothetical protein [Actinomycetota bacterium]
MKLHIQARNSVAFSAAVALTMAIAMVSPASGADAPVGTSLIAPAGIPNIPAVPFTGTKMANFTTPQTMVNLSVVPAQGIVGDPIVVSGKAMAPNATFTLTWSTSDASWVAGIEPNTANYMGTSYSNYNVNMATVTTDATGSFSFATKIPSDWGGVHDIYAVADGVGAGHGGLQVARGFTMKPTSGPVGTPITVTYTGLGPKLYAAGSALIYDNHFAGEMMARWTRGTATAVILASGAVGKHFIQANEAISFSYLNVMQSPVPYANSGSGTFTITKDNGAFKPYIQWPSKVTPTVSNRTTLSSIGLDPATKAVASLSVDSGPVGSKTTVNINGLTTTGSHQIVWATVVGNRVNCTTGTCWVYNSLPLATVDVTGPSVSKEVTIPDHLGGWHVIQIKQGDMIEAQTAFYVKESIMPFLDKSGKTIGMGLATADVSGSVEAFAKGGAGTPTNTFKEGEEFTISIKGVGWTQFDNTLAVTYDNSYIGYGCGFNSNGYLVVHLRALGGVGTHIIDLRPLLYTQQPSFANTPYGMAPVLTFDRDFAGLALGYQIPAFHFAINIKK